MRLNELKNLSDAQLYSHWKEAYFPFDRTSCCGYCMTQHMGRFNKRCDNPAHESFAASVSCLGQNIPSESGRVDRSAELTAILRAHLDELFALRLFYAELYRAPVPEYVLEEAKEEHYATQQVETVVG